jgi:hypothetical protein
MTIQRAEDTNKIANFTLITDETEVTEILQYLGRTRFAKNKGINGLFVEAENGDYTRVYGFQGIVPFNNKELYLIK